MTEWNPAKSIDANLDQPPQTSFYGDLWTLIDAKGCLGYRGSFRERLARKMVLKVLSILMRDHKVRRMFCITIATEMRRTFEWMDAPETPPKPHKD